ncbi:hypothetical protein [aff. Roholtiella sp. LEGE 12411]|uniref:hypothetical protein n=1 Tax=aff. Roholtiella sp. LEGE 12411 TaxID=1828822 RepID=UPI00188039AD|nr:hypothetical protein [aff. Roholtiella sp. LEGE 12411]MBE9038338.1 hypothetical protein [aff. Roholtiella sp. LEGE 12411]
MPVAKVVLGRGYFFTRRDRKQLSSHIGCCPCFHPKRATLFYEGTSSFAWF